MSAPAFDYIVVGAGSAGCVLAARLSENGKHSVLLLEAGPDDTSHLVHVPKGFGRLLMDPNHCWYFTTEPSSANGNRTEYWLRGKVLGGSSAVNGMVYMRAQAQDYDDWEQSGLTGWGWSTMSQYFKRMEDHSLGADENRGAGGPLKVTRNPDRTPFGDAIIEAGKAMGLPVREDLNQPNNEGIGYITFTIRGGRRQSSAVAFLKAARNRKNLTVLTDTVVQRVLLEGRRAVGAVAARGGVISEFRANREVIVACGALQSPKILQLSGIGPAAQLRSLGIEVRVDSPDVGENLREHILLMKQYRLRGNWSQNRAFDGLPLAWNSLRYMLTRSGPLATGSSDIAGFIRTRPELTRPDAQIMMSPYSLDLTAQSMAFEKFPGLQTFGYPLRPESRGSIMARSANPDDPPIIRPNYLATDTDRRCVIDMLRWMRRWIRQPVLASYVAEETTPGPSVESDDEIIETFRQRGQAGYHAAGTCRMGADAKAVLDARLRVRGANALRVVDLSSFPALVSGNTNGPVMAVASRAADLILEDATNSS